MSEPDYKELYFKLLRTQDKAIRILQEAHQETEETYLSVEELEETEPAPLP